MGVPRPLRWKREYKWKKTYFLLENDLTLRTHSCTFLWARDTKFCLVSSQIKVSTTSVSLVKVRIMYFFFHSILIYLYSYSRPSLFLFQEWTKLTHYDVFSFVIPWILPICWVYLCKVRLYPVHHLTLLSSTLCSATQINVPLLMARLCM